jgi:sulfur-oxidizing protein SoxZ
MANKMKIRAFSDNGKTTVKAIIFHPMETGFRKDKKTGKPIPAQYITEVNCMHNNKTVLKCNWGPGVSKNPFVSFRFSGAKAGDAFKMTWVDNTGKSGESSVKIS